MDPYGPPRKRPRPDQTAAAAHNGVNGHGLGVTLAPGDHDNKQDGSGNRTKPCTKFFR